MAETEWGAAIDHAVDADADAITDGRRHLHAHPEPSGGEFRTTEWLAARLSESGIPHRRIPSGRGLIAGPTAGPGVPIVAFRADVDALPIHDLKAATYRSTVDGLMHACGHDAHANMALGAARALWLCRGRLPWPVAWRALFQPAEETGQGAAEMIEAGAVEGVRAIVALHVDPDRAVGRVGQRPGMLTAFCSDVSVTILGKGGHAARPFQAIDPIAAAALLITAVYQGVPRSVDAREPSVVTFGSIRGGATPNVIPDRVELLGTMRTTGRDQADAIEARVRAIGRGIAEATGTTVDVRFECGVDAVRNDPEVTRACAEVAADVVGAGQVDDIPLPSLGGEDFGGYLAHAPGCMLRLGIASSDSTRHPLHSPHFDLDERALAIGAKILARSAVRLARP